MAIGGLGSTANLLAALRGEMARKSERTGKVHAQQIQTPQRAGKARHDKEQLRAELKAIIGASPLTDEESRKRLRRRMVQTMLLWEFGSDLREHAEWQPMLESITQTLEASPRHSAAFEDMIRQAS